MDISKIKYTLLFSEGREKVFEFHFKSDTLASIGWVDSKPPEWTALEFHKCSNCPLKPEQSPYCPAALNISRVVSECRDLDPLEPIRLKVKTHDRILVTATSVQSAVGSLTGLVMAASDCPHTSFFKPLAKFHVPLGGEEESIFRALSVYLVGQFFRHQQGEAATFDLDGLLEVYRRLEVVNSALAGRVKAAGDVDAGVQSFKEWDVFSGMFALRISGVLEKIKPLFQSHTGS